MSCRECVRRTLSRCQVKDLEEAVALRERKWDSLAEDLLRVRCCMYLLHIGSSHNRCKGRCYVSGLWKKAGEDEKRGLTP